MILIGAEPGNIYIILSIILEMSLRKVVMLIMKTIIKDYPGSLHN